MTQKNLKSITKNSSPSIKLDAEIGTEMQMQISSLESRFKLSMVGILPDQYLIYELPIKILQAAGKEALKPDTPINIRCISRGEAFGFHSSIIDVTETPYTLLFVKYPDKIQQHTIRKNQRVKCLLPAKLMQESINIPGTVADISRSGCHFQAKKTFTPEQANLTQATDSVSLALSLPGLEGEKTLTATIKNTFIASDKAQIGIEFNEVDEQTLQLLDNFIAMSFDLPPF